MRSPAQISAPEISIRSEAEVWANSRIFAPGREMRRACSTRPLAPVARMTASAPRPAVARGGPVRKRDRADRRQKRQNVPKELRRNPMVSVAERWRRSFHQHSEDQSDGPLA